MELKINIVEAAAELAEQKVVEHFEDLKVVYQQEENGDTIYTEEAQEVFNAEYDEIFTKLVDCKVTPIPNLFNSKHIFSEDLVESLANKVVERKMKELYLGATSEKIAKETWRLGELNSLIYSPKAQIIFNTAKEYYEMQITQFEI